MQHLSSTVAQSLITTVKARPGDVILLLAGLNAGTVDSVLGRVRVYCADLYATLGQPLYDPNQLNFLWVEDFPLFEPKTLTPAVASATLSEANSALSTPPYLGPSSSKTPSLTIPLVEEGFTAVHHPFTAPVRGQESLLNTAPSKVLGQHYDIVLNGVELGGGRFVLG